MSEHRSQRKLKKYSSSSGVGALNDLAMKMIHIFNGAHTDMTLLSLGFELRIKTGRQTLDMKRRHLQQLKNDWTVWP